MLTATYVCARCGASHADDPRTWRCTCGGPLSLLLDGRGAAISVQEWARERDPFRSPQTPLVAREWGGREVHFKLDFLLPTGSFKDRGTAMMVARIAESGIGAVHEDSSGNAGASLATYCAAYGILCTIYVPSSASAGKLAQIRASGARLERVDGPRESSSRAAVEAAASGDSCYASHNWNPWFLEGVKSLAYELTSQCTSDPPDAIVVPAGYGSLVLGLAWGFDDLRGEGGTSFKPRIYACQAERCAPLDAAFRGRRFSPEDALPTVAEGVASARPVRTPEVVAALRAYGGGTVTVSDPEILHARTDLARRGLFVEPTAAVAPAACLKLVAAGVLRPKDKVVVVLTGHGLKAPDVPDA